MGDQGPKILVIDDEIQIRRFLKVALVANGFDIEEADSGRKGLENAVISKPDLIILDMGLPDMEGMEVLKELREWSKVPVIILSVIDQENIKIEALDNGANDYIVKPFGMGELLARVRAALRPARGIKDEPVLDFGELTIDLAYRKVSSEGRTIKLTPTEWDILKTLAINRGKVLTQKQLMKMIWGPGYDQRTHYLRVYIGQLRQKIEKNPSHPQHIITEPGVGYRFI